MRVITPIAFLTPLGVNSSAVVRRTMRRLYLRKIDVKHCEY